MESYPLLPKPTGTEWRQALKTNPRLNQFIERIDSYLKHHHDPPPCPEDLYYGYEGILLAAAKLEDIDAPHGKGETLLHWATVYDVWPCTAMPVLLLLILGADPNARDCLGRTPLHWMLSLDEDEKQIAAFYNLAAFGASADIPDWYGATAKHHALFMNNKLAIDFFVDPNSDVDPGVPRAGDSCYKQDEYREDVPKIKGSQISDWIEEHASSREVNRSRIHKLLTTPGSGILAHKEEVREQSQQILALFTRVSEVMSQYNPLFTFIPRLAGSNAEGTKCGFPDEQDVIFDLVEFGKCCLPEMDGTLPHGFIALKVRDLESETILQLRDYVMKDTPEYLDKEAILKSFVQRFTKTLNKTTVWKSGKSCNIYPDLHMNEEIEITVTTGDIGAVCLVWFGEHYKNMPFSIDIVPAISLGEWCPPDATIINPLGDTVLHKMYALLKSLKGTQDSDLEGLDEFTPQEVTRHRTYNKGWCLEDLVWSDSDSDVDGGAEADIEADDIQSYSTGPDDLEDVDRPLSDVSEDEVETSSEDDDNAAADFTADKHREERYENARMTSKSDGTQTRVSSESLNVYQIQQSSDSSGVLPAEMCDDLENECAVPDDIRSPEPRWEFAEDGHQNKHSKPDSGHERAVDDSGISIQLDMSGQCEDEMDLDGFNKMIGDENGGVHEPHREQSPVYPCSRSMTNRMSSSDAMSKRLREKRTSLVNYSENNMDAGKFRGNSAEGQESLKHSSLAISTALRNDNRLDEAFEDNEAGTTQIPDCPYPPADVRHEEQSNSLPEGIYEGSKLGTKLILNTDTYGRFERDLFGEDGSDISLPSDTDSDWTSSGSVDDLGDMGFRLSYCNAEIETMKSFPLNVKRAYILSKALLGFVPPIRHQSHIDGIKDIFSYMIKMSLFHVYDEFRATDKSCIEEVPNPFTTGQHVSAFPVEDKTLDSVATNITALAENEVSGEDITEIAEWVGRIFRKMECAAKDEELPAYFEQKNNILNKVIHKGDYKGISTEDHLGFAYPALKYVRAHCKMIRALVNV